MRKICLNADFLFSLSLCHPDNHLENMFIFLFALLQISSKKKILFLGRKNIGGACAPLQTPPNQVIPKHGTESFLRS